MTWQDKTRRHETEKAVYTQIQSQRKTETDKGREGRVYKTGVIEKQSERDRVYNVECIVYRITCIDFCMQYMVKSVQHTLFQKSALVGIPGGWLLHTKTGSNSWETLPSGGTIRKPTTTEQKMYEEKYLIQAFVPAIALFLATANCIIGVVG